MTKLLSVCVPSYNMEKYLRRNLNSFIASGCLEELEVIVVNDGSKDSTLQIANEFHEKYPNTIIVIDKANGHYGSCVNAAIKIARGKYFRIVDADDWVDSDALSSILATMHEIDVDVIYTRYSTFFESSQKSELGADIAHPKWNDVLLLDTVEINNFVRMHQMTFSMSLLKSIDYEQTEGICYTDVEYVFKPLVCAQKIYFSDLSLYQYFMGRNDQSVSTHNMIKNFMHFYKVLESIYTYNPPIKTNRNYSFLKKTHVNALVKMMFEIVFASGFKIMEWETLLRRLLERLELDNFDISPVLDINFKGMPWIVWWYRGGLISTYKFRAFRFIVQKRLSW